MKRRAGLLAGLAACALPARGRTLRVRVGDGLQEAVAAAQDGDTLELDAGDHRGQAAVITQRQLTLRGRAGRAVMHADGAHAEGKALLVIRGGAVRVEGIEFRGVRVPDGNGAGIRFERGQLDVHRCAFFDNEMGLLSANTAGAELAVIDCEFGQAPRHDGLLHHLLYVGTMHSLTLQGCRFSGGWRGHLVKSRAARNLIVCNQLVDGADGQASYELELPNGGLAWVLGNVLGQGPNPQNEALIAYHADRQGHTDNALFVAHNSFVNEAAAPAAFVRRWLDRLPAGSTIELRNNLYLGASVDGSWGSSNDGNVLRPLADWDRAATPRVALHAGARPLPRTAPASVARGVPLMPSHEATFPVGMRALPARDAWRPGAFQD